MTVIPNRPVQAAEAVRKFICDEIEAMANFSCGCDPRYCSCHRAREVYNLAAEHVAGLDLSPLTAALPFLSVQGAVNIDEIVQPLEDIHAPGGLCRWTDVATAIGEVRRALRALEPTAARELALEEVKLERSIERWRGMKPSEVMKGSTAQITYALEDARKDILSLARALSSPDHADAGKVEGDGWKTIESAPKDGTPVLAYQAGRYFKCWMECDQYEGGYFWQDEEDSEPSPTHWRPLPTPPSSEVA